MDEVLIDLHACVNNLGTVEDGKFYKDVYTTVCLRDILRYIRRESKECEIRQELGKLNLVPHYLIPIIKGCYNDSTMFDITIRLTMNLTQPALICFRHEIPTDSAMHVKYLNVDTILKGFKLPFADKELLSVLSGYINSIFNKEWEDRSEDEHMTIERILIIIRNVLFIDTLQKDLDEFWSEHDRLIMAMANSGWFEVLIYLANSEDEHRFAFHTLEIISLIFREQKCEDLIFKSKSTETINNSETNDLLERRQKRLKEMKNDNSVVNSRVLRYGGTFLLTDIKSSSGGSLIYHRDIVGSPVDLEKDKKLRKIPKNQLPNKKEKRAHKSSEEVMDKLNNFCLMFLEHGYNTLMSSARNFILRNALQPDDETYYLWSLKFFVHVCRINRLAPEFVSSTVSSEIFHWVYEQAISYHEQGSSSRKTADQYFRKLQLAMLAYKELIHFIYWLGSHKNNKYKKLSTTIKGNVFYQAEYIDLYPMLLGKFNPVKQNREYLRSLIEGSHLLIKILQEHRTFNMNVIRKLKKKPVKNKQNKKKDMQNVEVLPSDSQEELLPIWAEMENDIKLALLSDVDMTENVTLPELFNPLAPEETVVLIEGEDPVDSQVAGALRIIQLKLRQKKGLDAVALLKRAQVLWPEEERLMTGEDSTKDIMDMLRSIMLAKRFYLDEDVKPVEMNVENNEDESVDEEYEEDNDDAYDYGTYVSKEVMFDLYDYLMKYTHPNIILAFGILLEDFIDNPTSTNNSLIHILHRLACKMKYHSLLYSLRNLNTFNSFLNDPVSKMEEYKEMKKFILYMLKKFMTDATKNPKLFIELLFPRSLHESVDMVTGYENVGRECKGPWNDELDLELERVYVENRDKELLPGLDLITVIESQFSDSSKTRRQIVSRMVTLGLINKANEVTGRKNAVNADLPWSVEEERQLIVLVDEYKNEKNPIRYIMNALKATADDESKVRRRRKVVKKILDLGLAVNEEELGIRRRQRRGKQIVDTEGIGDNQDTQDQSEEGESTDSEHDDNEEDFIKRLIERVDNQDLELSVRRKPPPIKLRRNINWSRIKTTYGSLTEEEKSWFVNMLGENIESRINGIVGNLYLIPMEEVEEAALANANVQALMTLCEFQPPNPEEGENFWSIPNDMTGKEIEYFKNCVIRTTEEEIENLLAEDEKAQEEEPTSNDLQMSERKSLTEFNEDSNDEDIEKLDMELTSSSGNNRLKRAILESDDEDDEDEYNIQPKKTRMTLADDSD